MATYELKLTPFPYKALPFAVNLSTDINFKSSIEEVAESSGKIFSDLSYAAEIDGVDFDLVSQIQFYVNGCYEPCQFVDGLIRFTDKKKASDRKIFLDCYGFVEISIILKFDNQDDLYLHSEYLSVLVRKGDLNESVKAMAAYVYNNQQELLFNGDRKPKDLSSLKESGYRSLESQIILANEIAEIYESSYGYFKANSRFKSKQRNIVDNFEKLQVITPQTLQFISRHPEQLIQIVGTNGIHLDNRTYQPLKTLTRQNMYSHDIYENRVIVYFLKTMIHSMEKLLEKVKILLSKLPSEEVEIEGYVHSSYFIFASTQKVLFDYANMIESLLRRFKLLFNLYKDSIVVNEMVLQEAPKPSAIFYSVPQYNKIFLRIHQWFTFGMYDFSAERFMLSFIKISSLYESYVLAKLIRYFQNNLILEEKKLCFYPTPNHWKYKNTKCNNTFVFSDEKQVITLYYQPVIFDSDKRHINNLGLYRNNTISLESDEGSGRRGHYYVPDFLIKIERNELTKYIICDAKFSSLSTIKNYYLTDLAYKYLFSISPITESESIHGLCVFYGQCPIECDSQSAYDRQLEERKIIPFVELIPIAEGINKEKHFKLIGGILPYIF